MADFDDDPGFLQEMMCEELGDCDGGGGAPGGMTAIDAIRGQLDDQWQEVDERTFVCMGRKWGCGFAEARVTLGSDGLCRFTIDPHLHVPEGRRREVSRWARNFSNQLIVKGLKVDSEGWLLFEGARGVDVLRGGDLDRCIGRGFSTIHGQMGDIVAMVYGGVHPWELKRLAEADGPGFDDEEGDGESDFDFDELLAQLVAQ